MKRLRYLIEAAGVYALYFMFKIMPLDLASAIGGSATQTIGPLLPAGKVARDNLDRIFPDMPESRKKEIIAGMWNNLGRLIAEYPHLEKIAKTRVNLETSEEIENCLKQNRPKVFVSAHLGNWEVFAPFVLKRFQAQIDLTYRAPNNPWSARLLDQARTLNGRIRAYRKSRQGGQKMMETMRRNGSLGILVDQKYNEGIPVPFFGHMAMTSPFFAQIAQKYDAMLFAARCERTRGAHFTISAIQLPVRDEKSAPLPLEKVIGLAHDQLESWIRQRPEQWLWIHRRWESKALEKTRDTS